MRCRLLYLGIKLRHLDEENTRRRNIAKIYDEYFADTPLTPPVVTEESVQHVYHQYVVRTANRDKLRQFLQANGVTTAVHYPRPVHLQPAYEHRVAEGVGGLPHTEAVCREIVSLPIYAQIADEAARYVAEKVSQWATRAQGKH